jgi:antitoxin component YwqK of YwqJK toxin-antitoxin module
MNSSRLKDVLTIFAIIGPLAMAACSRKTAPRNSVEISADALRLTNGVLVQVGTTNIFTGVMAEKYPGGELRSRSSISNGVLWGVSEGWHTNGQLQVREQFRAGIAEGLRTKWETNGAKISEAMIAGGKLNGPFRRWHRNGVLAEEVKMKNGQPDGLARAWYPSGCPKAEMRMAAGSILEQKRWADGELPAAMMASAAASLP